MHHSVCFQVRKEEQRAVQGALLMDGVLCGEAQCLGAVQLTQLLTWKILVQHVQGQLKAQDT